MPNNIDNSTSVLDTQPGTIKASFFSFSNLFLIFLIVLGDNSNNSEKATHTSNNSNNSNEKEEELYFAEVDTIIPIDEKIHNNAIYNIKIQSSFNINNTWIKSYTLNDLINFRNYLLKYSNLPSSFNTMTPKTPSEQLWIKDGNSKFTTPISRAILRGQELALKLPHGRIRSGLIGSLRNLRHFMRNPALVGGGTIMAPLTVFEGFYDIGVMTYCSIHCCGGDK